MAKKVKSNNHRKFSLIFFFAITILAIPLTIWSLNNVSTNTKQEASSGHICSTISTWSGIVGHTDYPTSVKFHLKFKNNCSSYETFTFSATRPTTSWTYSYSIPGRACVGSEGTQKDPVNQPCEILNMPSNSTNDVYVTIKRPANASKGNHYLTLRAHDEFNTRLSSYHVISYLVIPF